MTEKMVTIATFNTAPEAHMAKGCLEANDIRVFLNNESSRTMAWHYGGAIGDVKLLVAEHDVERAVELLESHFGDDIPEDDWLPTESDEVSDIDQDQPDDEQYDEEALSGDELANRAFRAAVIGTLFFPLVVFSLWQLLRIGLERPAMSDTAAWKGFVALAMSLTIATIWWVLFVEVATLVVKQ